MNKLKIAKSLTHLIVTAGAGKIAGDIIKNNSTPSEGLINKILYTAGGFGIGGLVAAETAKYTDTQFDKLFGLSADHKPVDFES